MSNSSASSAALDLKLGDSYIFTVDNGEIIYGILNRISNMSSITYYTIDNVKTVVIKADKINRMKKSIPKLLEFLWGDILMKASGYKEVQTINTITEKLTQMEKNQLTPRISGIEESVIREYFNSKLTQLKEISKQRVILFEPEDVEKINNTFNILSTNVMMYLSGPYGPIIEVYERKSGTPAVSPLEKKRTDPMKGYLEDKLGGGRRPRRRSNRSTRIKRQKRRRQTNKNRCRH
jgi:hypothetical protein